MKLVEETLLRIILAEGVIGWGAFIAEAMPSEGRKRLEAAGREFPGILSVLLPEEWFREFEPLLQARPEQVRVFLAEKKLLETLTGYSMYQGLLAIGKIPAQRELSKTLECSSKPHLLVGVDGLSNAENLGALVRNCAGFSAQALLVGETCCSAFLRRAVRSSMGAVFQMPIRETSDLVATLQELKLHGIRTIAAHPHVEGRILSQADFTDGCCIVFGSEGSGIAAKVLEVCDDAVAIPMPKTVDSLNVASAAAVFLYEANRQRQAKAS